MVKDVGIRPNDTLLTTSKGQEVLFLNKVTRYLLMAVGVAIFGFREVSIIYFRDLNTRAFISPTIHRSKNIKFSSKHATLLLGYATGGQHSRSCPTEQSSTAREKLNFSKRCSKLSLQTETMHVHFMS